MLYVRATSEQEMSEYPEVQIFRISINLLFPGNREHSDTASLQCIGWFQCLLNSRLQKGSCSSISQYHDELFRQK